MNRSCKNLFLILAASLFLLPGSAQALTLNECIEAALQMNPGLEAASYRVKAARAAHSRTRSTWYPHLAATGNYTRTDNPSQAFMMSLNQKRLDLTDPGFDPADPGTTHNMRISLALQYVLFDGGQSRLSEQMAKQGIEASGYALSALQNELVYQVTRGYYNVLKAEAFIAVFRETTASLEKSLGLAQDRFDQGAAVKTDVLNLQVQLAQAQEDLIDAENRLRLSLAALNTSIGATIVSLDLLTHSHKDTTVVPTKPETQADINERPELLAAALLIQTKKVDLRRARRGYLPRVNAFGSMDMDSRVSTNFEESFVGGIEAKWDIFDGHARSATISEARSKRNEAVALLKETRKLLELDLKEAQLKVTSAHQRLEVTLIALESAEESLRITRSQYENGTVDITALLNAQTAMTTSSARNKTAYYDYMDALANLTRAAGTQQYRKQM